MSTHSDQGNLDQLALRAGADIRAALLRTLVDLYVQKPTHTAEEAQHFTELALRLFDQTDAATRAAMAQRLATYPSVPAAVARRLAEDADDVAALDRAVPEPAAAAPEGTSPAELSNLFFAASASERRMILINLAYAPQSTAPAIAGDARQAARQIETAALAHNPDGVARALERWLGIAPTLAQRIVHDPLGEPIVVTAKVIGLTTDAVQRILLFVNPAVGRSVYRVYELAMLFETIDVRAAQALVGIWRAAEPRPPAKAALPSQDDAGRGARRTANHQAAATPHGAVGALLPRVPIRGVRASTSRAE